MTPFKIKICGIRNAEDAIAVWRCGADAVGLNFYEPSPRFVSPNAAAEIMTALRAARTNPQRPEDRPPGSTLGSAVKVFGVFVNLPVRQVAAVAMELGLDGIQLHGDESPAVVGQLRQQLRGMQRCQVIRAIRTKPIRSSTEPDSDEQDVDGKTDVDVQTREMIARIREWAVAGVDGVLIDAAVPGEFGGTGATLDWKSLATIDELIPADRLSAAVDTPPSNISDISNISNISDVPNSPISSDGTSRVVPLPLVLAGGLTPDNVGRAIQLSRFRSVDVASGVESEPGVKDHQAIERFVAEAKQAFSAFV